METITGINVQAFFNQNYGTLFDTSYTGKEITEADKVYTISVESITLGAK